MDFNLNEEQRLLQETVRKISQKEFKTRAEQTDKTNKFPEQNVKQLSELGLMGLCLPVEYGGQGMSTFEFVLVLEQIAQACVATAGVFLIHAGVSSRAIGFFGSEKIKEKYLPDLACGKKIAAFAMTEPGAGSAATDCATRGKTDGNNLIINGTKCFISNGAEAEVFTTVVRLCDKPGAKGLGLVIIDKDSPGFSIGKIEDKMGVHGFSSAELIFDDCKVPKENIIVEAGDFKNIMKAFNGERCGNSSICLGISQAALDYAVGHTKTRKQFGKEICEFQGVQWMLADMRIKVEAMRLLTYKAAHTGDNFPDPLYASMAKAYCNETVNEVVTTALQLFGSYGYMKDYPIERLYRDARPWSLAGGSTQMQKNTVAAEVLGKRFSQRKT